MTSYVIALISNSGQALKAAWPSVGSGQGSVWKVCVESVLEVGGKWVESVWEVPWEYVGRVWEVLVEAVSEAVRGVELSTNICETARKEVLRNCARGKNSAAGN